MISPKLVYLTKREARTAIRLLNLLQVHLKSAVESTLLPGQTEPDEESDKAHVTQDRIDIIAAQNLVEKLGAVTKGGRAPVRAPARC